ncbi:MAG: pyroglutamyl-peptidase I [Clostridia bacterium]|nr:pyroglutamyl-peptidase I [Clostridia bacterium]
MKILLTGFEPFGKLKTNASWEAVKLVSDRPGKNLLVHKLLLPVEYEKCADICLDAVAKLRPEVVLCVGVAAKRRSLTPEYVAVNVKDSTSPDNAGKVYIYDRIIDEGESALYTNLPLSDAVDAILSAGVPASASFDAGTYVCNNLFYRLMYDIKHTPRRLYGGFLHVPTEKEVTSRDAARAIEAILLMLADKGPIK